MEQATALSVVDPIIPVEVDAPAVTDWLGLSRQAYEGSTSYLDTNLRNQWERNLRQWQSKHPLGSKYLSDDYKGKPKFFRPKTRAAGTKFEASAAAAYFSTQDVVDISARDDSDDRQRASAALWQEVLNHRLTKSVQWFMTVMGAAQDAWVMGAVVSYQDWDQEYDRPNPELTPLENLRIDPAANWLDPMGSSPYIIHLVPMHVYEVRERSERMENPWRAVTDGQMLSARAQAYDSTRLVREGDRTDPKGNEQSTGITDFDIVWVHRVIMRRGGQDLQFYTLGTESMLTDPIPLAEVYPWLRKGERPYVMGVCVVEAHRANPSGMPELTRHVVQEMNDLANNRMENVQLVLKKRFFVKRHKQVDIRSLVRGTAGSVTMLDDPEKDVKELEWRDVTASSYQEQDRLNMDHDDVTGEFSGSSVASNRKLNETVGGMNMLRSAGQEVGDYRLKTFTETWLEQTLDQILRMCQHRETDVEILALAGAKAGLIDKFGISVIDDDLLRQGLTLQVNLSMGATNPLNNLEKFMVGLEKLESVFGQETVAAQLDFTEIWGEIAGKLGFKDGKRFLLDKENPREAALLQKIAELEAKVAQKKSPALDAADVKLKLATAIKTLVEAEFGATQAGELIASIPEIAPVADAILQTAGYTPPVPAGVDPNLPMPQAAGAPTGATTSGAAAASPGAGGVPGVTRNTSPQQPAIPASATAGMMSGIEGGR